MRSMNLFNLAALVASVMVLAIAAVLIPDKLWSDATITSVVMFAFAVVFVFYAPSVISKSQTTNDAAQIAAIGPLGILSGGMLLLTAGAFVFAILGRERMAWAMNIFSCGSFVISLLMLRAASNVIGTVVAHDVAPSKHIIWQSEIQSIGSRVVDAKSKHAMEMLAEKFRYAASDVPGGTPQDSLISDALQEIHQLISGDSAIDLQGKISIIEMLIFQRDIYLRTARSKT